MHAPLPSSLHTLHLQWAFAVPAIVYLVAVHLHQQFASLLQSKQRLKVLQKGKQNKNALNTSMGLFSVKLFDEVGFF